MPLPTDLPPLDLTQGKMRYRLQHLQGRNELIVRAVGWKKGLVLRIIDATAGLGREALLLGALGNDMTLFERHPTVHAMLKTALRHAAEDPVFAPIVARLHLETGCAIEYLKGLKADPSLVYPEVIYCDPMFPERKKSALVKKEMQILQSLVAPDHDADQLVALSCQIATKRVVVKRALSAPPLMAKPHIVLTARSHRFDIYLRP